MRRIVRYATTYGNDFSVSGNEPDVRHYCKVPARGLIIIVYSIRSSFVYVKRVRKWEREIEREDASHCTKLAGS